MSVKLIALLCDQLILRWFRAENCRLPVRHQRSERVSHSGHAEDLDDVWSGARAGRRVEGRCICRHCDRKGCVEMSRFSCDMAAVSVAG
jgi:hypothetical protein